MKKEISNINGNSQNYYTDPILYEEGFYKDKKDEERYLKKIENLTKNGVRLSKVH